MKKVYVVSCTHKNIQYFIGGFKTLKEALSFVNNHCNYISKHSLSAETLNALSIFTNDAQKAVPFSCAVFHLDDYDYHYQILASKNKNT